MDVINEAFPTSISEKENKDKDVAMKKILIILIFLLLISGCAPQSSQSAAARAVSDTPGGSDAAEPSDANTYPAKPGTEAGQFLAELNQPNSAVLPERFAVSESGLIPGWKKLEARQPLHQFETNGQGMSWRGLPENNMADYVIHFPGEWTFDGFGIFYDRANNKVAELAPVARDGMDIIDEVFRDYQPPATYKKEPIVKELVAFNPCQGLRIIEKVPIMDGERPYWYSHMYLISNGNYLFTIIFYTYELKAPDQELFDKIAGTFRFK